MFHSPLPSSWTTLFSDATFDAVGSFCPDKIIVWRYEIGAVLSSRLRHQAANWKRLGIPVNDLLELCGMLFMAWFLMIQERYLSETKGDPILMRGQFICSIVGYQVRRSAIR